MELSPEVFEEFSKKYDGKVLNSNFLLNFIFDAIGYSIAKAGKCDYCQSLIPGGEVSCRNCGAPRKAR